MRIAVDASRSTVQRVTGTEHYAIELIRALIRLNTHHQMTLYFRDAPAADLFPASQNVEYRMIPFRRAWTHMRFAAELWRDKPDVTFVPAHTLPILFPGRAVVTVHDLGARRAAIILADSQATASDLTRFYGTPPDKIKVVYPGVEKPPVGDIEATKRKYSLPERYFLFIGTLQPRKNITRIVQAYQRWKGAHPSDSIGLVLAGAKGWLFDPKWIEGVGGIVLPGYIDDMDKGALYSGAQALIFPSLYEGFGFPVIEAMHCGTPVITSNTSSLPELMGDAGIFVNPLEVDEIAAAMTRVSGNPDLRQQLSERGYQQAAKFTWEIAAQQTLNALELAVQQS